MTSGRFVTLEGGEGAGKSTQARALAAALEARGLRVVVTREPGGSEGAEAIRALLLSGDTARWSARSEALLFAAARADHVERVIAPALADGAWVISDRFLDSTRAYQGGAEGIDDAAILALHAFGSGGLMPDRTFVLQVPVAEGERRAQLRDAGVADRFARRGAAFHERVAAAFAAIAAREPERVRLIDGAREPDAITADLLVALGDLPGMTPLGNAPAHAAFRAAMSGGALHHAWLFAGPEGVGKATFARAAAARLLAEAAGERGVGDFNLAGGSRTTALLAAGAHPDFRLLTRLPNEKKDGELARSIPIAQVRGLGPLFATTPSLSPRRVVLIDSIDDVERPGASNALLKSLEEPPAGTIFLLVSHAPGRLLPTIRSRCRLLRFEPLSDAEMAAALRHAQPEAGEDEIAALVRAGQGSPGRALRYAGLDLAGIDAALRGVMAKGDADNRQRLRLSRELSLKAAQPRYEAFLDRAPTLIAEGARARHGADLARALDAYAEARELARAARANSLIPADTVFEMTGLIARLAATG